jgi:hypothetical protein
MAPSFGPSIERRPADLALVTETRTADRATRFLEIRRAIRGIGTDVANAMSSSSKFPLSTRRASIVEGQ